MSTPYHTDFVAWADETVKLLRQRRFDEIDLELTRSNWGTTITQTRNEIADDMEDSPSLRSYPAEVLDRVYQRARREVRDQSQRDLSMFPE